MCKRVLSFRILSGCFFFISPPSALSPPLALLRTTSTATSSMRSSQRSEYKLFQGIFIFILPHFALAIDIESFSSFPSSLFMKEENKASRTNIVFNSTSFNSKIPSDNAISIDARLSLALPSLLPIILLNVRFNMNLTKRFSAHSLALNTTMRGCSSRAFWCLFENHKVTTFDE